PSCYAQPAQSPCDTAPGLNLVDTLEGKGLTWTALMQSMPSAGFLGPRYPASGPTLYAQKHNPFVYFNSVASNPVRLAKIVPLTDLSLSQTVAHLPNFTFIVPDQCNDMHGTSTCSDFDGLLKAGDAMVKKLTFAVLNSPSFTRKSALFIVWDEDDYSSNLGCCDSLPSLGGGHTLALVMTKKTNPRRSAVPINHYSLLRTIEEGFGLPYLGNSGDPINVPSMFPLL
ncbi:MAG TPA: alkaline phosphatase family protein, partial [Candidatus Baltobacteraceae bacterium]|nr:alkaline phosphatase family protein [Candidatus Baltobacteraceae bacterium]